ncbi:acyl-CoA dehydrogenase family protein [Kitasatospora viridis]|uniref:Alkylation response protein AidB-like acyl-CoA dehydrogenase n=1 Tax=Kitasatospora viridis TaxID=281105 RepID=A0A561SFI5_9ACTN|nr:acyl-CoA dehydrogenase family protein [Kitasatospora viridis]TWF73630.1 alkylation response protein AidB-like acyl-CoA dehydrogenase [Kitasatospora viridis]
MTSPPSTVAAPAEGGLQLPKPQLDRLDEITEALAKTAAHYDRTGEFPHAAIQLLHDAGLLTATVGAEWGGPGVGFTDLARILLALGRGDTSVALIACMTLVPHALQGGRPWPEALYRRILAESTQGPTLLNHARAEPDTGRGGGTVARRTANGWAITGRKRFVTGAEGLSYFLLWATTDEAVPQTAIFVVPGGSPGIEILPTWRQLGMRSTVSHEVVFTDVEVGPEELIRFDGPLQSTGRPSGPEADPDHANSVLLISAGLYLGAARAAQDFVLHTGVTKVPTHLGRPIATGERFRHVLGEIEVLLSTAEQLVLGIAGRLDRGELVTANEALSAKVAVIRDLTRAVELAVRLLGSGALSQDNPLERIFRDVQAAGVHAPQEDSALLGIGTARLNDYLRQFE